MLWKQFCFNCVCMISASVTIYQLPSHTQTTHAITECKSNGSVFTAKSKIVLLYMESKKPVNLISIVAISSDISHTLSLFCLLQLTGNQTTCTPTFSTLEFKMATCTSTISTPDDRLGFSKGIYSRGREELSNVGGGYW